MVGDPVGIPGVVLLFSLFLQVDYLSRLIPFLDGWMQWLVEVAYFGGYLA
jgi:hypothetical protein